MPDIIRFTVILDAFETPLSAAERESVDEHCSHCSACAQFAAVQSDVDQRLRRLITAPTLNTDFQNILVERIRRKPRATLPAWSPDVAYGIGAFFALIVSAMVLPFRPAMVLTAGVAISVAAYLLQSFIFVFVNESSD
jgi:anti-sigma factor RsiW